MSTIKSVHREAHITGGVLATGRGAIGAAGARLGYWPSPGALTSCVYLEARHSNSIIEIGRGTTVNNGCIVISAGPGVHIGENVLIGPRVVIFDSDFHALDPDRRGTDPPRTGVVRVGDDVFIGAAAIILQGVTIGRGAVIGAGAVVAHDVAAYEVVVGSPSRVVKVHPAEM